MTTVAIVGGGPAGLMAAEVVSAAGLAVTVYDRMPSLGRKFLMAGRGGLNLTHSEPFEQFLARYGDARAALAPALTAFGPVHLQAWSAALGEPTFVGSSGRVFPRSFKASPLLRAWLRRLEAAGVRVALRHRWTGWDPDGTLRFDTPAGPRCVASAATVLALGGASWPRLGSDGTWTGVLADAGIEVAPLRPSNGGFVADWPPAFGARFAGQPLKGLALSHRAVTVRGEATITSRGLEGGAVYALSAAIRDAIAMEGATVVHLALRPDLSADTIARRLAAQPPKASMSTALRKALKLPPAAIALIQEARHAGDFRGSIAALVNAVPVRLTAASPLAEAISTAGGVRLSGLQAGAMLHRRPGTFVAGEMLDWEAPTGGYLLQGAFATGAAAGRGAVGWLARA